MKILSKSATLVWQSVDEKLRFYKNMSFDGSPGARNAAHDIFGAPYATDLVAIGYMIRDLAGVLVVVFVIVVVVTAEG
jgi:hypothetical protein